MSAVDFFTVIATSTGLFFFIAGTAGLLRFPDVFCRLHALTKVDNLGLGLIVIGLVPQTESIFDGLQLILTWLFIILSSAAISLLVGHYGLLHLCKPLSGNSRPQAKPETGDKHGS